FEVRVDRLDSRHEFNPITGDFHHTVTVTLSVTASQPDAAVGAASVEGKAVSSGGSEVSFEAKAVSLEGKAVAGANAARQPSPASPRLGAADGETRLSQVYVGEKPAGSGSVSADKTADKDEKKAGGGTLVWKPFPPP